MGLNANIVTEPGLFDLAKEDSQHDVLYQSAVSSFLATEGIAGTAVESDLTGQIERRVRESTAESFRWLDAVRSWLLDEEHSVVDEETQMVKLGAYWLTVPPAPGASTSIDVESESTQDAAAAFKLAGIGGGPKFTITLNEGITTTVDTDTLISLSAPGTIQTIDVTRGGQRITQYPRLASLDKDDLTWRLTEARPPSPAAGVTPIESRHYDASSSGEIRATFEVASGTDWEFGVDFNAANLGLEIKWTTTVSYKSGVKFTYALPAGGRYLAATYSDIPTRLWSIET
ncbi:hypothetical protein ACWCQ1_46975 [Streptomyces sp. NPDC002144]